MTNFGYYFYFIAQKFCYYILEILCFQKIEMND
jgi:hypothetical protein